MSDPTLKGLPRQRVDPKEFELPETLFVRDIENRVFQQIVLQCLSRIEGVGLVEGNFIHHLLGRSAAESIKGVVAEQDSKNHSVSIKVEVSIRYGLSIPKKAEEIQTKISEEITHLTGLHVSSVHIVFKELLSTEPKTTTHKKPSLRPLLASDQLEEEYTDEF